MLKVMAQVPISMASWLLLLLLLGVGSCGKAPYLTMGDGSALEFEFPERSRGIMVVSSRYGGNSTGTRQPRLRVASLAPDVLAVENISALCCGAGGFLVAIRSGPAGLAPLQLRLLDRQHLVEERRDYRVRVAAAVVPVPALSHFSENPVLYALLPLIFLNKCAFGCKVEAEALRGLARHPQPMLLGIVGQFVAMPLYGYLLSWALALPQGLALGLVITCSSPGGGGGYLYSLLLGGDVTLAISMTLLSTVAAAGLMPLSWALYGRLLSAPPGLHVPVGKILGTLLFIAAPISTGIVVKCKLPRVARLLLLLLKPFSFLLLLGGLAMAYHMGAVILAEAQAPVVLAGLTVPAVGLLLGYGLAAGLGLPGSHRRTVAIEVGVQNSLLALAVLQLSFQRHQADMASQAPFVVALSGTSEMLILVLVNLLYQRLWPPPGP